MKLPRIGVALCLFGFAVASSAVSDTQPRAAFLDRPADVRLPDGYDADGSYPVYVFLPYTGGRAVDLYLRLSELIADDEAIVVLPSGRPRSGDYLPDFTSFVRWYEERLISDLDRIGRELAVDPDRVVLVGFSLGGDLGWALSVRNPERIAGAVMAGTRASYPPPGGALASLKSRGYRGAFIIGSSEIHARATGIARAESLMRAAGIDTRFRTVMGGHTYGSPKGLVDDLHWVLDTTDATPEPPATVAADGTTDGGPQPRISGIEPPPAPGSTAFPRADFPVVLRLPGDWSAVVESDSRGYDSVFTSRKGNMRIRMYASADDPIPPRRHLERFVDGLPFTRDIEYFNVREWNAHSQRYEDAPAVSGVSEGRRFIARAWWPNYYPVLAVISVPERMAGEHIEEMRGILE